MGRFVSFVCPTHGEVLSAPMVSRVECRCGQECAPEGLTLAEHKKRYFDARKKRRRRA